MMQFSEVYPDEEIVVSLIRQLSWTHFLVLLPVKDPLAREFYAQMCSIERWSVRTLRERVDSMLFERTAVSHKPDELIRRELSAVRAEGDLTPPLVLKDPYVLDFVALGDRYLEKNLEDAILRELEHFFWSWARASVSWPGSGAFNSMATTFISTCCSITANCVVW